MGEGFQQWLMDEITEEARLHMKSSHKEDCNSNGAGYDLGYYDALCAVRDEVEQRNRIAAVERLISDGAVP